MGYSPINYRYITNKNHNLVPLTIDISPIDHVVTLDILAPTERDSELGHHVLITEHIPSWLIVSADLRRLWPQTAEFPWNINISSIIYWDIRNIILNNAIYNKNKIINIISILYPYSMKKTHCYLHHSPMWSQNFGRIYRNHDPNDCPQ
jgi:hypothetical protein